MAKQTISLGTAANDGTGDPLRTAFTKTNENFTELYTSVAALQSSDADLTAIAALTGTSGFLKKTSTNTWTLDTSTYLTAITSNQITTALGYTPYNGVSNSSAFLTGITSAQIIAALGYTPYSAANPTGYVTSVQAAVADQTGNSGKFLTTNGTATSWATIPTLNQNTTGSAATLTTPRAINGVNFDGSAAITVTAAAGTLSGTTLNATVVSSSLTSVGTIATGTWQGSVVGSTYGGTGVNNGANTLTLAGNVSHAGSFTQTFTATANTTLTLPTTGTLATLDGTETFTNKTLTSPTLTTPALGTPASGHFSSGTFTWPSFNQNTSGTAAGLSATLVATSGGTGQSSYAVGDILYASTTTALSKLTAGTSGYVLTSGGAGVAPSWAAVSAGAAAAGTLTGTTLASNVVSSSLTSVGTIATGVWNGTAITAAYGGTGLTSLGTGVATFLGTPSSANLLAALTDETGTGALLFGTSPAITTSITTASTTFALINTTATTVNFAGAATTALNIGASNAPITGFAATATTSSTASSLGYLGIPQSGTATTATLAIGDAGKHIYVTTAGQTITIPANASVAYPIGTTIGFIAGASATTVTIAITSDTMYLGGTGTTGSRTLAAHGMATAVKVAATTWYISGNGLT